MSAEVRMPYRVDMGFIGTGKANVGYGGYLRAWSFLDSDGREWLECYRRTLLDAAGREYLPVYRMADGEYRFLMGRKLNLARRPLWRELAGVAAERIGITSQNSWKTSWGETYATEKFRTLRAELIKNLQFLSRRGILACYLNDNGLNAFVEYNPHILKFFSDNHIAFGASNYVPFHFVVGALCGPGFEEFYSGRRILIVSGIDAAKRDAIRENLFRLGVASIQFVAVSATSALEDKIDLSNVAGPIDFCFVAAGIGSANILPQLEPLSTVAMDIGGFINCIADDTVSQHGGVFRFPQ